MILYLNYTCEIERTAGSYTKEEYLRWSDTTWPLSSASGPAWG